NRNQSPVTETRQPEIDRIRCPRLSETLVRDFLKPLSQFSEIRTESPLFAKYGRKGGGDAASAALMKNVRKTVTDPKVTVHSLRHNMQDRMLRAGVDEHDRKLVLGHSVAGEANRYGSDEARLVATTRAMKQALGEPG
ncbi:hypothetical protein GR247_23845, partial [Rhizobium leguminosarum]|nr:hypothetical protein [Rhizobium leguminosarum]